MWCSQCNARLLTMKEMESGTNMCGKCQKQHADTFKERLEKLEKDE